MTLGKFFKLAFAEKTVEEVQQRRCLWQGQNKKLRIERENIWFMPGLCFACVCLCVFGMGSRDKNRRNAFVYFKYYFIQGFKESILLPFPACGVLQKHYLIAAQLTLMFLASYVSDLFVPHRSFYYLYFMHCFMLCCSGAPRR